MRTFKKYIPEYATEVWTKGNTVSFAVPSGHIEMLVRHLHLDEGLTLKLIDATDERQDNACFKIWYVFGVPGDNLFVIPYIKLEKTAEFPSVTAVAPGAAGYERKIKSFFGLTPLGNQDQRSMILHENWPDNVYPLRKDFKFDTRPKTAVAAPYQFAFVEGEGIYEIPVGPIHAGIIEPGHFRFSVLGESIMLLEGRLGFVHKGSEKLFEQLGLKDKLRLSEKISADSSLSHSLAFCQAIEKLADIAVPARAEFLRTLYAELERLANHLGDIGFIMLDTGYNFGGANGSRLREMVMQINERLSGSRFLRGVNCIGGVTKDISGEQSARLREDLEAILADFEDLFAIAEECDSLLDRLKATGPLAHAVARDFGVVGVPARAIGIPRDARAEHPYAAYPKLPPREVALQLTGDVYARYLVRVQEVRSSVGIIKDVLRKLPAGPIAATVDPQKITLQKNAVAIGCVEGWRGEIVYLIVTDASGGIQRVAVRDPSFINWQVVGSCGQGQVVPDFPLINKSFNLSYTGNDL